MAVQRVRSMTLETHRAGERTLTSSYPPFPHIWNWRVSLGSLASTSSNTMSNPHAANSRHPLSKPALQEVTVKTAGIQPRPILRALR